MRETSGPMITTIIPTYRRPKSLKRAIQSVLSQTFTDFQVCVYDNDSGDETASVVAELSEADSRVKYYRHSENIGALNNYQFGLERVDTPFFSFFADDDYLLPKFYEVALDGFKKFPDVMFSVTGVVQVGEQKYIHRLPLDTWTAGYYTPPDGLKALLKNGHSEWTGIVFRREILDRIGSLDLETGIFTDLDFTLRSAARCSYTVSKTPCAVFSQSDSQCREPQPLGQKWPGVMKMIENLTADNSLPLDVRQYAESVLREKFKRSLFSSGLSFLFRGNPSDAFRVAELLKDEFDEFAASFVLYAAIGVHKYMPFARDVFEGAVALRRKIRSYLVRRKQAQYQELAILIPE